MAGKTGQELTVDDLESSGKLQGKNLLDIVKAPKLQVDDTFTLSQSSGLQSSSDPPSSSVISILKKKPPASPSVSSLTADRKVSFPKDSISDASFLSKQESTAAVSTEKVHKECPTCTCHLKESSLKLQSMLQSIPEKSEFESDLHSIAPLSGNFEESKNSLHSISKLKSQFLEVGKGEGNTGMSVTPKGVMPYSWRPENSPSRIFRARMNQRTLKTLGKIDDFYVNEERETFPSPELKLTALRSLSSTNLLP